MRLFLCEKPSQGKDIGRILGATQRGEGCLNGSGVIVTWCIGHLVEAAAPEAYDEHFKRWSIDQLPIIPQHWRVEVKPKTATQFKVVKALLAKATQFVIATDADREGELIAREIIDLCGYRGPIERLWLSALNDASIRTALGKLKPSPRRCRCITRRLARSRADWLVGMNLSRCSPCWGGRPAIDGVLSVGRVQTPTLRLVVDRDREIARFKSVPYWAIDVSLSAVPGRSFVRAVGGPRSLHRRRRPLPATAVSPSRRRSRFALRAAPRWCRSRPSACAKARRCCSTWGPCRRSAPGSSGWTCRKRWRSPRPCTRRTRPRPTHARTRATCPKACSPRCPPSSTACSRPTRRCARSWVSSTAPSVRAPGTTARSRRTTASSRRSNPRTSLLMSEKELAVYRLIRAHYLAQFLPHHEFDRTVASFPAAEQTLVATGKQVVVKGWRLVLAEPQALMRTGDAAARSQVLPALREGLACQVAEAEIKALKTMPPKPYTQGELVKSMKGVARFVTDPRLKQKLKDTTGIGTEATRANIISVLIARGYIVKKGRAIRASDAAFTLIDAVPAAIADPGTTAVWEQALDMIEAGQLTLDVFLSKQAAWISQLIAQYGSMSLSIKLPHGPACPQCGAPTRQRTGKSGPFWSCSRYPDCKGTLPVESGTPKRGASRSRSSGRKGA
jgi:DNA topoisomerase-3